MEAKVLVVDDEADVLNLLSYNLSKAGYDVAVAGSGVEAVERIRDAPPDAMVLDLMMPGLGGIDVCRILRAHESTATLPILMLTAHGQVEDRIKGLENGADDYVTKPFSPKEIVLRLNALLRRASPKPVRQISCGPFRIDLDARRVVYHGQAADLTDTEFKLLRELVAAAGKVVDREHLLRAVWGYSGSPDTRTVDTHIRRLREKLGAASSSEIETVRGYGYRISTT